MPSSYSDIRRYYTAFAQLHIACRQLLHELGWPHIRDVHGYVVEQLPAAHGIGFENITSYIHDIGAILITCENTDCEFDAGRNREVVERFLDELGKRLEEFEETARGMGGEKELRIKN